MRKQSAILAISLILLGFNFSFAQITQQDAQRFSAYYSNGLEYLKKQQFSSAITEFRKVLRFSPYDATVQNALANAYLGRAQYYQKTTHENQKALVDYKSAAFYALYWNSDNSSNSLNQLGYSAKKEADSIEKKLSLNTDTNSRLKNAKILKAQGELAAAGYDFQILKSSNVKDSYENLANIYKNLNNTMLAMENMQSAIKLDPKNAKLHFLYGVMLDEAKNYDASWDEYNLALQYGAKNPELLEILENKWTQNIVNNPSNAQNYINLGAIYQKQGAYESAKIQYQKAYSIDPTDKTSLYNLASLYIEQKNYQGAIETYNKLLAGEPNNIEIIKYKAQAYLDWAHYDEALAQYDLILKIDPNDQSAKFASGDIVDKYFKGQKLINYLTQKANSNPKSYEAQFNLALELHKNKNYEGAKQYYKKAQTIDPSKDETYINLAQIYIDEKNYPEAQNICQKGLMLSPNNKTLNQYLSDIKSYQANSQYEIATKLYEQKQYKKAIEEYSKIQNKTTEVKMAIASCYVELNDYKSANSYWQEILSNEPNNINVLENSAYAYYSMGNTQDARIISQKILALDKNNQQAKSILDSIQSAQNQELLSDAISKYEKGDYQNSLNLINKLLSQSPNDQYGIYYKGLNLDELQKPKEAITQYKLLISKNPNFESAYYSLAVDLDNMEKYSEAVQNYDKFLTLTKDKNEMTDFAKNRTKELKDYLGKLNAK